MWTGGSRWTCCAQSRPWAPGSAAASRDDRRRRRRGSSFSRARAARRRFRRCEVLRVQEADKLSPLVVDGAVWCESVCLCVCGEIYGEDRSGPCAPIAHNYKQYARVAQRGAAAFHAPPSTLSLVAARFILAPGSRLRHRRRGVSATITRETPSCESWCRPPPPPPPWRAARSPRWPRRCAAAAPTSARAAASCGRAGSVRCAAASGAAR